MHGGSIGELRHTMPARAALQVGEPPLKFQPPCRADVMNQTLGVGLPLPDEPESYAE